MDEYAEKSGMAKDTLLSVLEKAKSALLSKRNARPRPFKDDKILTSWNGLMIHLMARAGSTWEDPRFTQSALKTAQFLKDRLYKDGRLMRRWRDNEARFSAGLDDYAFLIKGLLTLFEEGMGRGVAQVGSRVDGMG